MWLFGRMSPGDYREQQRAKAHHGRLRCHNLHARQKKPPQGWAFKKELKVKEKEVGQFTGGEAAVEMTTLQQ